MSSVMSGILGRHETVTVTALRDHCVGLLTAAGTASTSRRTSLLWIALVLIPSTWVRATDLHLDLDTPAALSYTRTAKSRLGTGSGRGMLGVKLGPSGEVDYPQIFTAD